MIEDVARYRTACLPRRSGKTTMCAFDLIRSALARPNVVCLYITLARSNAKRLIWPMLLSICREQKLGPKINETDLALTFANGSTIYCSGAKDRTEIEKFRGLALVNVYIDESQSFRDYLGELIDDVIAPALRDYNGKCTLTGTPGPIPKGYFYRATQSKAWSNHFWSGKANVFLEQKSGESFEKQLADELQRMGVTVDHPTIQREWFGQWRVDTDKAVFKYNADINDYQALPLGKWNYVIGIDVGYEDSDAIAVLGWVDNSPTVYVVEEYVKSKQGVTELCEKVRELYNQYSPRCVVMDPGGGGRKIAAELGDRYSLPIESAEKTRKFEFIELLNDALRRGDLLAKATGQFAQDSQMVEWETPMVKLKNNFHSDITDAVLYGFRECLHWLEKPLPVKKSVAELIADDEAAMELAALKRTKEERGVYEDEYDNYNDV